MIGATPRQGQRKGDDRTGEEAVEMISQRRAAGADRDLGSKLRAARYQVQDGRLGPTVWKLV